MSFFRFQSLPFWGPWRICQTEKLIFWTPCVGYGNHPRSLISAFLLHLLIFTVAFVKCQPACLSFHVWDSNLRQKKKVIRSKLFWPNALFNTICPSYLSPLPLSAAAAGRAQVYSDKFYFPLPRSFAALVKSGCGYPDSGSVPGFPHTLCAAWCYWAF